MSSSIQEKMSLWGSFVSRSAPDFQNDSYRLQLKDIYRQMRRFCESKATSLQSNVTMQDEFSAVHKKVNALFFSCMLSKTVDEDACYDPSFSTQIRRVACAIYHENEDWTEQFRIDRFPQSLQSKIFANLATLHGVDDPDGEYGKNAFFQKHPQGATSLEKFQAILCSVTKNTACCIAAEIGQLDLLRSLVASVDNIEPPLTCAIVSSQANIVEFLLSQQRIPNETLFRLLHISARINNKDVFRLICEKCNPSTLHRNLTLLLKTAIQYDCDQIVDQLKTEIPSETIMHYIQMAAQYGAAKVISALTCQVDALPYDVSEECLAHAINSGRLDVIVSLIATTIELESDQQEYILSHAQNHKNFQPMIPLVLALHFNQLTAQYFAEILSIACQRAQADDLVPFLRAASDHDVFCHNRSYQEILSSLPKGYLLQIATCVGDPQFLCELMQAKEKYSHDDLEQAFFRAIRAGHLDALSLLIKEDIFSQETLYRGLILSVEENQRSIFSSLLLICGALLPKDWDEIVQKALEKNSNRILDVILSSSAHFTEKDRLAHLEIAARYGSSEIVELLVQYLQSIPEDVMERMLSDAIESDDHSVILALLTKELHFDPRMFERICNKTRELNKPETMLVLLLRFNIIGNKAYEDILLRASRENYLDRLSLVVRAASRKMIDCHMRGSLVIESLQSRSFDCALFWINNGPIFSKAKSAAQRIATQAYVPGDVMEALNKVSIASDHTFSASWNIASSEMTVSIDFITNKPALFLQKITSDRGIPESFVIFESDVAQDRGGVSKQVYDALFSSLFRKNDLYLNKDCLIPSVPDEKGDDLYRNLGRLFAELLYLNQNKHSPIFTGPIFSKDFYSLLMMWNTEGGGSKCLQQLARLPLHHAPCFFLLEKPSDQQRIQNVQTLLDEIDLAEDPEHFSRAIFATYTQPLKAFWEGVAISTHRDLFYALQKSLSIDEIYNRFTGYESTSELVLSSLVVRLQNEVFNEKIAWLKAKISHSSPEWLKSFIISVTGQRQMHLGLKIQVIPASSAGYVFRSNTCIATLTLPIEKMEEEEFLKQLEDHIGFTKFSTE